MAVNRRRFIQTAAAGGAGLVVGGVAGKAIGGGGGGSKKVGTGLSGNAGAIATARGLSAEDVNRAVSTFTPPGKYDDYFIISSSGHAGQVFVYGLPSMRLLKSVGVFTPEPWQGWGYGDDSSMPVLTAGVDTKKGTHKAGLSWGDAHHPALSETNGEYDGRFAYINDKANGRVAMIDLRDFKTKQILDVPNLGSSHGGAFVTPNTEYLLLSTNTPTLVDKSNIGKALDNYADVFRGYSSLLSIDQKTGRFDLDKSFQIELPPYTQDLADAGKLTSMGWIFINSYNTELATGGVLEGKPPIEVGSSKNDYDYMHLINWKKAEQVVAAGKAKVVNGIRVIPIDVAVAEGVLFLLPEPRSPHGVDVAPNGSYIVVAGKLDPHVTIYSIEKILKAIDNKDFETTDRYGIPVIKFDSAMLAQVELGVGPLHTQFDDKGYGYTSLFIESAVAKWSLGEPFHSGAAAWKLVDKLPVHYNIGHLGTVQGDTLKPLGKYLIAFNKWSIDRYPSVGPLKPQNFQLIDISGEKMQLLSDTPIGNGEPHYAQIIDAKKIKAWVVYPPGTNPLTMEKDPNAVENGKERIERNGNTVEAWITVKRSHFTPDVIHAKIGDRVLLHLSNVETTPDATHGFCIPRYNVNLSLEPGVTATVDFIADEAGAFGSYCTEFCSALHMEMQGWLLIEQA